VALNLTGSTAGDHATRGFLEATARARASPDLVAPASQSDSRLTALARSTRERIAGRLRPGADWHPQTVFDLTGFRPAPGQTIVLTSQMKLLGDNLLDTFSMIHALHETFPSSKIRVLSPQASLLRGSSWLEPIHLDGDQLLSEQPHLKEVITPGTFVLDTWPLGSAVLDFARGQGAMALGVHASFLQFRTILTISAAGPSERFANNSTVDWQPFLWSSFPGRQAPIGALPWEVLKPDTPSPDLTFYESVEAKLKFIFGDHHDARLPMEYFADLEARRPAVKAWLDQAFPGGGHDNVALFNLNTAGNRKVQLTADDYGPRLKRMVEHALQTDPTVHILITPPEQQFGQDAQATADALVKSHPGRVAFMPPDKALWLPLMHAARYVASQDSGFVHVALLAKPAADVLTFGPKDTGARLWRKADQPFVEFPQHGDMRAEEQQILDWISGKARTPSG